MSDFKSKLPGLKELSSMMGKLCTDVKKSVGEIIEAYNNKRNQNAQQESEGKSKPAEPTQKTPPKTKNKPSTPKPNPEKQEDIKQSGAPKVEDSVPEPETKEKSQTKEEK